MEFSNKLLKELKEILTKIDIFVQQNKGEDEKNYEGASLQMGDYTVYYRFYPKMSQIIISNMHYDSDKKDWCGSKIEFKSFRYDSIIALREEHGNWIVYSLRDDDIVDEKNHSLKDFSLEVSEPKEVRNSNLTPEAEKSLEQVVATLKSLLSSLTYNQEETHKLINMTAEAKKSLYSLRLEQAHKRGEKFLPSVMFAVKWWSEKLKNSEILGSSGDERIDGLLQLKKISTSITAEEISTFEEALATLISEKLSQGETSVVLYTDYSPVDVLAEAVDQSGISSDSFPIKTAISVSTETVVNNKTSEELFGAQTEFKEKTRK